MSKMINFTEELKALFPNSNMVIKEIGNGVLDLEGNFFIADLFPLIVQDSWIRTNLGEWMNWKAFRMSLNMYFFPTFIRISSAKSMIKEAGVFAECKKTSDMYFQLQAYKRIYKGNEVIKKSFNLVMFCIFDALLKKYEYILQKDNRTNEKGKKYTAIITSESEGKELSYISEHPWEGCLEESIMFDTIEEFFSYDVEGLFYQLFDNKSGERVGYGLINDEYPASDIHRFENASKLSVKEGELIIISGFSRAGKNAIAEELKNLSDNYIYSVSATTRAPRPGERNEVDYFFISTECFENIKEDGGFFETAEYCGNCYGTLSDPVKKALNEGRDMILILETEGAMKVKEIFPTAITFFIAAPAAEVKTRMKETGIVGEECKKRLAEIQKEISMIPKYDYIIMNKNGKLQENAKLIHSIIKGHKMKTSKSLKEIEALREEYN